MHEIDSKNKKSLVFLFKNEPRKHEIFYYAAPLKQIMSQSNVNEYTIDPYTRVCTGPHKRDFFFSNKYLHYSNLQLGVHG